MSLIQDLLPTVDALRGLNGTFGRRVYTATYRTRVWSGARPGEGTPTDTLLPLKNAAGTQDAAVESLSLRATSLRAAQASAGRYLDGDFRIGPLTPAYTDPVTGTTGGYTPAQLQASSTARATEVHVILAGPGEPTGGSVWTIAEAHFDAPLGYFLVIRRTERTP